MTQAEVDRAVAHVTGETVSTIKRLGFLLADPVEEPDFHVAEPDPYVIDWDQLEAQRRGQGVGRAEHEPAFL